MEKVKLIKVEQFSLPFFIGAWDPRKLVRIADQDILKSEAIPEAQRPIDKKHLKEIAEYVGKKQSGTLPATIIISTKDKNKLYVQHEVVNDEEQYFIDFPSTDEEVKSYGPLIDVIDGQHRLFAFHKDYIDTNIKSKEKFLMPFSLFETPLLKTRQSLFLVTNEKQKSVNPNLLLYLKEKLELLDDDERKYYPLIKKLYEENASPLKGRIIMSAEKIKKGLKSKELLKIFKKAKLDKVAHRVLQDELTATNNSVSLTNDLFIKVFVDYLRGWEEYYGVRFNKSSDIALTKISGLRYIIFLFETFVDQFLSETKNPGNHPKFNAEYVREKVANLETMKKKQAEGVWKEGDTIFTCDAYKLVFRGEGATVTMAQNDQRAFKTFLDQQVAGVNPFRN